MRKAIYAIGHSTHSFEEFVAMLTQNSIELVIDVRTVPKSRHNPQFNKDSLTRELKKHAIAYLHMPGLGGLRHPKKESLNTGWKNSSFRGFADYMQTDEFKESLHELIALAQKQRVAIMCAEALPWRCHRSLIADALTIRGIEVLHIMSKTSVKEHSLTPWAKVEGETVTYPEA